jgi:hypothetical protein
VAVEAGVGRRVELPGGAQGREARGILDRRGGGEQGAAARLLLGSRRASSAPSTPWPVSPLPPLPASAAASKAGSPRRPIA